MQFDKRWGVEPDFSSWDLESSAALSDVIAAAIRRTASEALVSAVEFYGAECHFKNDSVESTNVDYLEVRVELPIGPHEDESPAWVFSLTKATDELVEMVFDPDFRRCAVGIATAFRAQADRISKAIEAEVLKGKTNVKN